MSLAAAPSGAAALPIASSVRRRILDELVALGPGTGAERVGLSAAEIGERFGLHVTTARFHLDRLIEAGVVEGFREARGTVGRPRKLYAVRFEALPPGRADSPYRQLSDILAEQFDLLRSGGPADAATAGFAWALQHPFGVPVGPLAHSPGAWLAKAETLAAIVSRWGHRCRITLLDGGSVVELALGSCPFSAVAHQHPELVQELHRGILTGVLNRIGEPDVEVTVEPIDDADCCVATLRTRTPLEPLVRVRADRP